MKVILASQSPRRRELLGMTGLDFVVQAADIDETMDPAKDPYDEVARVSRLKALAVKREPEDIVVAADTIVVCGGQVLGKPRDEADALRMLRSLSGRTHQVMTGMTVLCGERRVTVTEQTGIRFRTLSDREIQSYIATGDPMDKAGAYGIQGGAALFATGIEGDYYNVMGLPVCRLAVILRSFGCEILGESL